MKFKSGRLLNSSAQRVCDTTHDGAEELTLKSAVCATQRTLQTTVSYVGGEIDRRGS